MQGITLNTNLRLRFHPELCAKCGHNFTGGAWEPSTHASGANNRIIRRGIEGATTSDMALIAVEAAIKYERDIAKSEEE